MPTKDYYEMLGIARDASGDEIKRAYRALARTHHPDVSEDKSEAEHRFKEINEAYEVLSDPNKRAQYDRFGGAGNAAGGFGGFGRFIRPPDSATSSTCSLRPAHAAAMPSGAAAAATTCATICRSPWKKRSPAPRERCTTATCRRARPARARRRTRVHGAPCDRCGGSGVVRTVRQTPLGQFVTQSDCSQCGGDGHSHHQSCHSCMGRGRVEIERSSR